MRLTTASSYALHAVAYLAANRSDKALASKKLATECGLESDRFLLKVLKDLVTARMLTSSKGPTGGYRLAKNPNQITVLEVIEAVDGQIDGFAPLGDKDASGAIPVNAKLASICKTSAEQLRKSLEKIKISDLAKG